MYKSCPLYALQSKKMLMKVLGIQDKKWTKNIYVQQNISPFIDCMVKPRLVEAPKQELKVIQKRIKNGLMKCRFPNYIFSGVKGKSYIDNAKMHAGIKYLYKIDISAFFPNTSREKVYMFFKNELKTSSDVAEIVTNLCTYDISIDLVEKKEIDTFIRMKKIKHINHLCTGASPSPLLSYLVNKSMFDEMYSLCLKYNVNMSVYVDDVVFSCDKPIQPEFRGRILKIVLKNGYNISKNKVKYYGSSDVKKVTGVIIKPDGTLDVPNKLKFKVTKRFKDTQKGSELNKLYGCVIAAKQIKKIYNQV